jgi:hypothetical protein
MNQTTDWMDKRYQELLEDELRVLGRRAARPNFHIEELEGTLKDLYIFDGADWDGRGPFESLGIQASIAAYETFIAEWKKSHGGV